MASRVKKSETLEDRIENAADPLIAYYEDGDDAAAVRMSLDALGGVLVQCSERDPPQQKRVLLPFLEESSEASQDLVEAVSKLYDLARGGSYGVGLTEETAEELN